jgi:hypothetical protein
LRKAGGKLAWNGVTLNHPFMARMVLRTEVFPPLRHADRSRGWTNELTGA